MLWKQNQPKDNMVRYGAINPLVLTKCNLYIAIIHFWLDPRADGDKLRGQPRLINESRWNVLVIN
jgi:hypothetical protein